MQWEVDSNAGNIRLEAYARQWVRSRPTLGPKTRETYEGQLRLHILPVLGDIPINEITPALVRQWHGGLFDPERPGRKIGANTIAKCYRLLHVILETAYQDELIRRNPCRIRKAGKEETAERPTASILQVFDLAAQVKPERRALVLLAGFAGLRISELLALRRHHVDIPNRRLAVREATIELAHGELITKRPKSYAGIRSVHVDPIIFDALSEHLDRFVPARPSAHVFTGDKGNQLRRAVWHQEWARARAQVGLDHFRFHDLRHTHGTLASQAGASIRETMRRLGHSTVQAAMVYQHASDERDQEIATAIGARIAQALAVTSADPREQRAYL